MSRTFLWRFLPLPGLMGLACVLSISCRAQETVSAVQEHFQAAQRDQQEGRFGAAVEEYQAALHLQPGLPEVYVNLGLVYYAQAKFDESARELAQAAALRPGMRGVSLWLGIDYVRLHRPREGAARLREAIRLDPADKLAQTWLGTALWDAGQVDAALLQLHRAAAQFPDDPDLLFALGEAYGKASIAQTEQLLEESSGTALSDLIYGTIYAGERDWTKAKAHLRRAIERDPHQLDARLELATIFVNQANLPAAQEQLDVTLTMAPRSAAALARSGEVLVLSGQHAEGLSRIDKALDTDRSDALDALGLPVEDRIGRTEPTADVLSLCTEAVGKLQAHSISSPASDAALAALHALAGDRDASQRAFRRIGPARSSMAPSTSQLARAMEAFHQHRYDDAEASFLHWLAAHPADRAAEYRLALARRQISIAQLARLFAVAPDSYHVHQMLGQFYVSLTVANEASDGVQEDEKAIAEYLAVAAARPDLPGVHFWLGHLYWKHGHADQALVELTRELEIDPSHPEANAELGSILVAQKHATEAIPHLESAIRNMPDLWPAYPQLGTAYADEKDYIRAEEMLKRALAHDQDGSAHYQLGLVLRAEGKTAQAAQVFAQARAIKIEKMAASSKNGATPPGAQQ